jgi:hypothetical protein
VDLCATSAERPSCYQRLNDRSNHVGTVASESLDAEKPGYYTWEGFLDNAELILDEVQNSERNLSGCDVLDRPLEGVCRQAK